MAERGSGLEGRHCRSKCGASAGCISKVEPAQTIQVHIDVYETRCFVNIYVGGVGYQRVEPAQC